MKLGADGNYYQNQGHEANTRRRQCGRKVKHTTQESVQNAMDYALAKSNINPDEVEIYVCPWCGFLHWGRKMNKAGNYRPYPPSH